MSLSWRLVLSAILRCCAITFSATLVTSGGSSCVFFPRWLRFLVMVRMVW